MIQDILENLYQYAEDHNCTVSLTNRLDSYSNAPWGSYNTETREIKINYNLSLESRAVVLIHELLHMKLDLEDVSMEVEEYLVHSLTCRLLTSLKFSEFLIKQCEMNADIYNEKINLDLTEMEELINISLPAYVEMKEVLTK